MTLFESCSGYCSLRSSYCRSPVNFLFRIPRCLPAGVVIGLLPAAPSISIDPATCLAPFIAPAIVDAAYDFLSARRFRAPIVAYAILAVVLMAIAVGLISMSFLGIPLAAGIVRGAIVAPPDAAAATASLRNFRLPRRTDAVLKGESLFNDATAPASLRWWTPCS